MDQKTSRERPKSAPNPRLKIEKGGPFGLCETPAGCKKRKKIEGGTLWGHEKNSEKKFLNEIFEQCHSAEKFKRGTLCDFLTSIVLQNSETNEGGTLWCNPKSFKKSHSAEKKWGYGGILSVFSRLWTSVLFFLIVLDALLRLQLLSFEVVEV